MRYRSLIPSVVIASLLLVVAGCESFLRPEPKSFSTTTNFYQTPKQFQQAVNGVYSVMRALVGSDDYLNLTGRRGPTLTVHFDVNLPGTVGGNPQTEYWVMTSSNANSEDLWEDTFDLVKEANVVINQIQDAEFEDSALKARIAGQAKTMRAFAYWFAVQTWGGVPIITEVPQTPGEAIPEGRASVGEVYQFIISDLKSAIKGLPISYPAEQSGRITRGAAKFLLGRTYLLTGDYQLALEQFEDLDEPQFGYELLPDYRQIFSAANENNAEVIWSIQYNPMLAGQGGSGWLGDYLPFNSQGDLLPPGLSIGIPGGTYHPTPDAVRPCTTPISYACYEEGDERFEASIAWYVKEGNSAYPEIAWPPRTPTSAAGDSLPYLYKFYWPNQVDASGNSMNDWVLFRFADVLLSAAEAHWRLGNTGQATAYLDRVRARAGLPPVDLADYSGEWTGSPLGDAILHERAMELLGEGHFYFDLKRFGTDVTLKVMKAHAEWFKERDPKIGANEFKIEEFRLLYPIPPGDILLANLEQNPGW